MRKKENLKKDDIMNQLLPGPSELDTVIYMCVDKECLGMCYV